MNILLVSYGSVYEGLIDENSYREELASKLLSGANPNDVLVERIDADRLEIVEIPDEATDYIIEYHVYPSSYGDGDDYMEEYIYYVMNGKICQEAKVVAKFKFDFDTKKGGGKYVEVKEVE